MNNYIAISGNIGAGKTTLSHGLSSLTGWRVDEGDMNNPFLGKFYHDMERWSLELQVWFLANRAMAWKNNREEECFLMDRTHSEEAFIFTKNLNKMGLLSQDSLDLYMNIFTVVEKQIPPPTAIIYIRCSVENLVENIKKRGREYEMNIDYEYLRNLNHMYEKWIFDVKVLRDIPILEIDGDKTDLINEETQKEILRELKERGLDVFQLG